MCDRIDSQVKDFYPDALAQTLELDLGCKDEPLKPYLPTDSIEAQQPNILGASSRSDPNRSESDPLSDKMKKCLEPVNMA